ncbi:MAG: hypothetical protein EZS28_048988, partial [Streblomastix strix]
FIIPFFNFRPFYLINYGILANYSVLTR